MTKDNQQPCILVTGGAGYVGSHSVLLLLKQKYRVVVIDNCANSYINDSMMDSNGNSICEEKPESLKRVEELAGCKLSAFYKLDLVDQTVQLDSIFRRHCFKAVIHYAALKSVSESISLPLEYYTNNLIGTINLLNSMKRYGCKKLIFSSSATVYGLPQYLPVDELHQVGLNVLNPYGRTKCMIEQILKDLCTSAKQQQQQQKQQQHSALAHNGVKHGSSWNIIALRYFNPVGAHPSGLIGEHTQNVPNNLMPYISQVAVGKRDKLYVFGNDYDTIDGTGVRDYIHIMDLASGHTHALEYLLREDNWYSLSDSSFKVFNLGTGRGYSVLETIKTFEQVNGVKVPYEITKRREGDAGSVYADASLARRELGWTAQYSLSEMCRDVYKWQTSYPDGYKGESVVCCGNLEQVAGSGSDL